MNNLVTATQTAAAAAFLLVSDVGGGGGGGGGGEVFVTGIRSDRRTPRPPPTPTGAHTRQSRGGRKSPSSTLDPPEQT